MSAREPKLTLTRLWCPVCGRSDLASRGPSRHFAGGSRCPGEPQELRYELTDAASDLRAELAGVVAQRDEALANYLSELARCQDAIAERDEAYVERIVAAASCSHCAAALQAAVIGLECAIKVHAAVKMDSDEDSRVQAEALAAMELAFVAAREVLEAVWPDGLEAGDDRPVSGRQSGGET